MKTTICRTNASEAIASSLGFHVSGFRGFPFNGFWSVDPHLMGRFAIKSREGEATALGCRTEATRSVTVLWAWLEVTAAQHSPLTLN